MSAAACHYGYEHDDSLYREEYIAVDPPPRAARVAVRWVTDGDYDAGAYQGMAEPDDPAAGYGDVALDEVGGGAGPKTQCPQGRAGSPPAAGIVLKTRFSDLVFFSLFYVELPIFSILK